jgi:hypothetical protein
MVTRDPADCEPRRIAEEHEQGITSVLLAAHRPRWAGTHYVCGCGLPVPCLGAPDLPPPWAER